MDVREKLVEILRKPIFPHELVDPIEAVADYLLDSGVTVQEWISVKDRLPDKWMDWVNDEHMEPREFIVFIEDAEIPTVLCFDGDRFCDREHTEFYDVTHWMPLPDAPKGE